MVPADPIGQMRRAPERSATIFMALRVMQWVLHYLDMSNADFGLGCCRYEQDGRNSILNLALVAASEHHIKYLLCWNIKFYASTKMMRMKPSVVCG